MSNLSAFGLAIDIAGVLFLGLALAATSNIGIRGQSGTYWGGNQALMLALVKQRTDARIGLPLLVIGFFLQFLGAAGATASSDVMLALAGVAVALIGACVPGRYVWSQAHFEVIVARDAGEDN